MEVKNIKKFILENIERFCDTGTVEMIDSIHFGDCSYGSDFEIHFYGGSIEGYNYTRNVIPMMKKIDDIRV